MKKTSLKTIGSVAAIACVTLGLPLAAQAANKTFTGNSSSSWNATANWNPSTLPTLGDNLVITSSTPTTGLDASFALGNGTTNGTLSFDTGSTAINVNANTSGTTARSLTFNGSATSALGNANTFIDTSATTNGTITLGGTGGLGNLTISMGGGSGVIRVANGTANLVFGSNSIWNFTASTTVNKTGAGTFTLNGGMTGPSSAIGLTLNVSEGTFTVGSNGTFAGSQRSAIALNAASGTTSYFNLNGTSANHGVGTGTGGPSGISIGTITGGTGVMNITAGTMTMLGSTSNPGVSNMVIGGNGSGTLNMNAGSVIQAGNLIVGNGPAGIMNLSGTGNYTLTARGLATSTTVATIANLAGSRGVLNVSGGVLDLNHSSIGGYAGTVTNQLYVGELGAGVLNVSGGSVIVSGAAKSSITGVTNNGLYIGGNAGSGNGTGIVNLSGGTIETSRVLKGASSSSGILNFNGGTLKAATAEWSSTFMSGLTAAYVYSGGGTINNNGIAITIGQALLAPTGQGATAISTTGLLTTGYTTAPLVSITGGGGTGMTANAIIDGNGTLTGFTITSAGTGYTSAPTVTLIGGGKSSSNSSTTAVTLGSISSGGLTFTGSNSTTLNGGNTYTGPTNVNAGTVVFANTNGASTIGSISVADGAALGVKVGNATASILSIGSSNLTLGTSGNTTLAFDFNSLSNPSAAMIAMSSGTLTLNGTPSFTFANTSGLISGNITLISYGSLVGTFTGGNYSFGPRTSGTTSNSGSAILLSVAGDNPEWTGLTSSNWTTDNSTLDWKLQTAGTSTYFIAGDNVLFNDNATGSTTIDINAANVAPSTVVFNNTSKSYVVNSSGGFGISGASTLAKNGSGNVTISTDNSYSGTTSVNAGRLILTGNNTGNGSIAVSGAGSVLQVGNGGTNGTLSSAAGITLSNGGSLAFNRTDTVTQGTNFSTAAITGNGSLVQAGSGTLVLNAVNTFSGGLNILNGTVRGVSSNNAFGSGTITIGDSSGSANATLEGSGARTFTNNIAIASGNNGTASIVNNDSNTQIYTSNTLTLNNHNLVLAANGTGSINFGIVANSGTAISGNGTIINAGTGNNTTVLTQGTISGNVSIRQTSTTSLLDLESTNTATGGVYIDAGSVLIHNNASAIGASNAVFLGAVGGAADAKITTANNNQAWAMGVLTVNSGTGNRTLEFTQFSGQGTMAPSSIVLNNNLTIQAIGAYTAGKFQTVSGNMSGTGNLSLIANSNLVISGALNQNGTITLSNSGNGTGDISLSGALGSGITGVTQNSAFNTAFLGGANTAFAGTVDINAGLLKLNNAAALNSNNVVTVASGGTLDLNNFSNTIAGLNGAGNATNSGAAARVLTLGGSGSYNFSGAIAGGANMAVTKSGGGTQILSGTNTYTGVTLVSAGTLIINGNNSAATGSVTVASGAVLGGNGTIGGNTVVNGTLAPGNSPGLLTFSGSLTLNGTTAMEITGLTRGSAYDAVDVGTALAYGGALTLNFTSTFSNGDTFNLFDFASQSGDWASIAFTGSYVGSLSGSGGVWTGNIGGQNFEFLNSTGVLSVVPEPSTWLLLAGGLTAMVVLRRRRRD